MYKDGSSLLDPKVQMGPEAIPQNGGMQVPKGGRNADKQRRKSLLQVTSLESFSSKDYYPQSQDPQVSLLALEDVGRVHNWVEIRLVFVNDIMG